MSSPLPKIIALALLLLLAAPGYLLAQTEGVGLPRFASIRADQVNLRTGPGVRYPIDWVYTRRGAPLEVIAEFDNWRKVRDWEGTVGWVHASMLTPKRTLIVLDKVQMLRLTDDDNARPVARLEPKVVGTILSCPEGTAFCEVEVGDYKGWLKRDAFWGVLKDQFF